MRVFQAPDGTRWGVDVVLPGFSNAMVVFYHPNGKSASQDRYNWYLAHGPESRSVTAHLTSERVLEQLSDADLAMLFRRSMPVTTTRPPAGNLPVMPL
jgi:hypothetical protein